MRLSWHGQRSRGAQGIGEAVFHLGLVGRDDIGGVVPASLDPADPLRTTRQTAISPSARLLLLLLPPLPLPLPLPPLPLPLPLPPLPLPPPPPLLLLLRLRLLLQQEAQGKKETEGVHLGRSAIILSHDHRRDCLQPTGVIVPDRVDLKAHSPP